VSDLTPEQERALVEALGVGFVRGDSCTVTVAISLGQRGLIHMPHVGSSLTRAGRICAQLIRERDEARAGMGPNGVPPITALRRRK